MTCNHAVVNYLLIAIYYSLRTLLCDLVHYVNQIHNERLLVTVHLMHYRP